MANETLAVLLIEDNSADVAILTELLADSDAQSWQITHFKRLNLALQQLQHNDFDVVLLDLSLPDSQGLDTIIQMQTAAPHIPIVVLTGLEDKNLALQTLAVGAQDYLVKGQISSQLLVKTVEYAIERMQILKKLQESEGRFRGVFNQTFQFMGLLSPTGILLDVNQIVKDVGGFKDEEVLKIPFWEAPYWEQLEPSQAWLKMAVLKASAGETISSEIEARTSAGTSLWLDFSIKPLNNDQGNLILLIAEGRDITKLKQAEVEIRQSLKKEQELNQMKNSFISMVSHEFRNPLATVSLAADMLQNEQLSAEKQNQYFRQIQNSIVQMLDLLDEILLLGRTEAGKVEAEYNTVDLPTFCHQIVETFRLRGKNQHQIVFSVEGSFTPAIMDVSLLRHILENLLSNAIKYSPKGGLIQFTLAYQDEQVRFCIQDQGIGIPQRDLEKLFEPFHRANNARKIQGTGLGLAIVKRYVDLLNGQIQVESQEGIGSTFIVILPLNPEL